MKKLLTLIIVASLALTIQAQDITNTLGTDGNLIIKEGSNTLLDFTQDNVDGPKLFIGGAQGAAGFPTIDRNLNLLVDGYGAGLTINAYGTQGSAINKGVIDFYSNRGTASTMVTALDGDNIGELSFFGTNSSTNFQLAGAKIIVNVDGTPMTEYAPMSFEFQTGNTTTGSVATRLKISSDGTVNIADLVGTGTESVQVNAAGDLVRGTGIGATSIDDLTDGKTIGNSVYVGASAGAAGTSEALNNTAAGSFALKDISTGDFNTAFGSAAGFKLTTGSNNTFLGEKAGFEATTGSNNIGIGRTAYLASPSADNQMNIGNTIYATGMTTAGVKVGIGNSNNAPTSTLDVGGSMTLAINSGTTTYTLTDSDYTYITNSSTANGADVTLPTASGITGRVYIVKNTGAASQLVKANSGETIDVATDYTLLQWEFVKVQSDGTNWIVIGSN